MNDKIAMPECRAPEPKELLNTMPAPSWLLDAATRLAKSESLLDRVASVGLIARLATAVTETPSATLSKLVAGEPSPTQRAARWAHSLDDAVVAEIERQALEEVGELGDAIETAAGDTASLIISLRHRRDDLESITFVLRTRDRVEAVETALEQLDRRAVTNLSALEHASVSTDELLSAVSWQEPDSWWAVLRQ